jgi:hypothetical protein
LVFAFAGNALAVGVYKTIGTSGNTTLATSTTRTSTFTAQISSNSDFGSNPPDAGVNIRVYRGTSRYTNDITFEASDVPSYQYRSYLYNTTTGTFKAISNLNDETASIVFSGNLYF